MLKHQAMAPADHRATSSRADVDSVHMVVGDMRSPMQVLLTRLEVLRAEVSGDNAADVEAAIGGVNALRRMTNSLLDVSRLKAQRMPIRRSITALSMLAHGVACALRDARPTCEIRVETRGDTSCNCDAELTRRIVENLVSNAVKVTPIGGCVRVVVACGHDCASIAVSDDGPTIPAEQRRQIFEPSRPERLWNATGDESSGLGLAFCRLAVEAQGGTIRIENGAPRGNVFVVELMRPGVGGRGKPSPSMCFRFRYLILGLLLGCHAGRHVATAADPRDLYRARPATDDERAGTTSFAFPADVAARAMGLPLLASVELESGARELRMSNEFSALGGEGAIVVRIVERPGQPAVGTVARVWREWRADADSVMAAPRRGCTPWAETSRSCATSWQDSPLDWPTIAAQLQALGVWTLVTSCESAGEGGYSDADNLYIQRLVGRRSDAYQCSAPAMQHASGASRTARALLTYIDSLHRVVRHRSPDIPPN